MAGGEAGAEEAARSVQAVRQGSPSRLPRLPFWEAGRKVECITLAPPPEALSTAAGLDTKA